MMHRALDMLKIYITGGNDTVDPDHRNGVSGVSEHPKGTENHSPFLSSRSEQAPDRFTGETTPHDFEHVGMTLLRIDKGVDTGAVYGYYRCNFDNVKDSHTVIQHRVVFDNLDALRKKLEEIYSGQARPIDTSGRASATWGQPWLTRHLRWKWKARRGKKQSESHIAAVS